MAATKFCKLIQLLHKRTDEKNIVWNQTVDEDIYQVGFPSYTVQIGQRMVPKGFGEESEYFIRILDDYNRTVEELTDTELKPELDNAYKELETLHRSARRQAMGVDKVIDNILSELEKDN